MNKDGADQIKHLQKIYDNILDRFHPVSDEEYNKDGIEFMKEINLIVLNANEEEKNLRSNLHKFLNLRKEIQTKVERLTKGTQNERNFTKTSADELLMLDIIYEKGKDFIDVS